MNINTRLFEFINNATGYYRPLDIIFIVATSYITLAVVGCVAVGYFGNQYLKARGQGRLDVLKHGAFVAGSLFATYVVVAVTKILVHYPRPFTTLTNLHVLITLPTDYSFPSGHAALTMAFATAIYFYNKRLGELLFMFAFVVGLARIYVGVHYPLDVGVGFLLGFGITKLLGHFFVKKETLTLEGK
jgi:undecaprenyl-diphosphatase